MICFTFVQRKHSADSPALNLQWGGSSARLSHHTALTKILTTFPLHLLTLRSTASLTYSATSTPCLRDVRN